MFSVNPYIHIGAFKASGISFVKPTSLDLEMNPSISEKKLPIGERFWDLNPFTGPNIFGAVQSENSECYSSVATERASLFTRKDKNCIPPIDCGCPPLETYYYPCQPGDDPRFCDTEVPTLNCTEPTSSAEEYVDFLINLSKKRRNENVTVPGEGVVKIFADSFQKKKKEIENDIKSKRKIVDYAKSIPVIGSTMVAVAQALTDLMLPLFEVKSVAHEWTKEEQAEVSSEIKDILVNQLPVSFQIINGSGTLFIGPSCIVPVLRGLKNNILNLPQDDLDKVKKVFAMYLTNRNKNQLLKDIWSYLNTDACASPTQVMKVGSAVAAFYDLPIRDFVIRLMKKSNGWRSRLDLLDSQEMPTNCEAAQWASLSNDAIKLAEALIEQKKYEEQKAKEDKIQEQKSQLTSQQTMSTEVTIPVASQASTGIASETKIMLGALAVIGIGYFFYRRSVL